MRRNRIGRAVWSAALVLALCLALLWLLGRPGRTQALDQAPRPYNLRDNPELDTGQRRSAAGIVRSALADPQAARPELRPAQWRDCLVVVGVFPRGAEPLIGWALNAGELDDSLDAAAADALASGALRPRDSELDKAPIRIDLAYRIWPAEPGRNALGLRLREGVDGLLRWERGRAALVAPYEMLLNPWEPAMGQRKLVRLSRMRDELRRRSGGDRAAFERGAIYRFRSLSYVQLDPQTEPEPLDQGALPLDPAELSAPLIESALSDGAHYLVRSLERNGAAGVFSYLYDPARQRYNGPLSYSVVRHAGCAYGLYALGAALHDEIVLDAADLAMGFVRRRLEPPLWHDETLAVFRYGTATLGSAALTLLAFEAMPEQRRRPGDDELMLGLARFIELMQCPDGRYYTEYHELVFDEPLAQAPYFPGEALLAMTRLARLRPDLDWVRAHCERAALRQIADFERTGLPENWAVQGLAELYRATSDARWAEGCFAMADALVLTQFPADCERSDWVGGFNNSKPPRTAPAGSRSEALREAYLLALELGDEQRSRDYGQALLLSARFVITQMYGELSSYYLPFPELARGGVRGSPLQSLVRIDYNQHALIGMLGAWEAARRRDAAAVGLPTAP